MRCALSVLVVCCPALLACGGAEANTESPAFDRAAPIEVRTGEPERDELYLLLMANADVPLSAGEHCESFAPADGVGPATFGYFYAVQLAALDEQPVALESDCAEDGGRLRCEANFLAGSDGESPWHCGIRFEMDASTRAPVPETVMCIGTC